MASRIDEPIDSQIVDELLRKFPGFKRAYNEGGLSRQEFDNFGPTARTLRQFIEACHELASRIRNVMIPDPDTQLG